MLKQLKAAPRTFTTLLEMLKLAWSSHPLIFVSIASLTILTAMIPLGIAWVTKLLFDLLAQFLEADSVNWSWLGLLLGLQVALTAINQLSTPVNTYLNAEMTRRLTLKVQTTVYRKINSFAGIAYFESPKFYDTIRLAEQGAQRGAGRVLDLFTRLARSTITIIGFVSVLLVLSPLLALLIVVAALPQLLIETKLGEQRVGLAFKLSPNERRKFFYSHLLSGVHAAKEIRLLNLGAFFLSRLLRDYRKIHRDEQQQQLGELRWRVLLGGLGSVVSGGAFVLVLLQAFRGSISLGDVTLFIAAIGSVQGALSSMVGATARLHESVLFYEHFTTLLALPPSLPIASKPRPVPKLTSGIEFRNVSFRYTDEHPWTLRHVDLFLPARSCLALVGLNGAGKTTLVKLLTRLYDPTEGQILWDGIDLREFDPAAYRQQIGTIFQDFMRYDLTAQENIGLGNLEQLDNLHLIQQSAGRAGVHEAIAALSQGYQTVLSRMFVGDGEGAGSDLSGGQWQKIALARMFMREADFLILDEPTAALDAEAELELYQHVSTLIAGCTSLLISHRFSTVRMADIIAVLENGRVTEYGPHSELMSRGGSYARLYAMQAQSYGVVDHGSYARG